MANSAYANYARSTTAYSLTFRALSMLGSGTNVSVQGLDFLGSTSADSLAEAARMVNDLQAELLDRAPHWFLTHIDLAMLNGVRTIDLPSAVRDFDVMELTYSDPGNLWGMDGVPIQYIPRHEVQARCPLWYNTLVTQDWPAFASLLPEVDPVTGFSKLAFYAMPAYDRTVTLMTRNVAPVINGAAASDNLSIQNPNSTAFLAFPDRFSEASAMYLAAKFGSRIWGITDSRATTMMGAADANINKLIIRSLNPPIRLGQKRIAAGGQQTGSDGNRAPGFSRGRGRGYGFGY